MADSPSNSIDLENIFFKKFSIWIDERLNRWEEKKRCTLIQQIADTLFDWIDFKEYTLSCNLEQFTNKLATFAYYIDEQFFYDSDVIIQFGKPKHRNLEKDWNEFNYAFNSDFWDDIRYMFEPSFDSTLFYSNQASDYFWNSLSEYIYKLLDIAKSPYVQAYDARDKEIDEGYINNMIEDGLLFIDKKGRIVTTNTNDPYKDHDEYSKK
jgi:hypothetical protein